MSDSYNRYLRARMGRKIQSNGTDQTDYGTTNFGSGFTITEDASANRLNISYNASDITLATGLSSSVGGISFRTELTPSVTGTGTVNSGSVVSITASLLDNYHHRGTCTVVLRHPTTKNVVYTKSISTLTTKVSGSNAVMDFANTIDDNFFSVNCQLSASVSSDSLIYAFTCGTGSSYSYTLLAGYSAFSFT
jgi:hypothetical protein